MSLKKTALHVLLSTVLGSAACIIYNSIYSKALELNFSSIINGVGIIAACTFGCVLMGAAYYFGFKWKGEKIIGWINILISVLSFASIAGALGVQLPVDIESPEMFPGLAIPMHFFPALAFFTVAPFFRNS